MRLSFKVVDSQQDSALERIAHQQREQGQQDSQRDSPQDSQRRGRVRSEDAGLVGTGIPAETTQVIVLDLGDLLTSARNFNQHLFPIWVLSFPTLLAVLELVESLRACPIRRSTAH